MPRPLGTPNLSVNIEAASLCKEHLRPQSRPKRELGGDPIVYIAKLENAYDRQSRGRARGAACIDDVVKDYKESR